MYPLVESICVKEGVCSRVELHEARMNRAFVELFQKEKKWSLEEVLSNQHIPAKGLFKCRVVYNDSSCEVEFVPYTIRPIATLRLIEVKDFSYPHKFTDRKALKALWDQRGLCDDVLIVNNGLITDSFYANIVFSKNGKWFTPASYLLPGTMRQSLLTEGQISERRISVNDIHEFERFKLINSMMEWNCPEQDVSNIYAST